MAGKVLCIEIGIKNTRVVEMDDRAKTPRVCQYFSLPTPDGVVTDGSIQIQQIFVEQLKNAISERKIRTRKVIFVMNSTRIANREVVIPLVKEKRIHDLLITNSAEFFPVDLVQYQLVHRIIEKNEEEQNYKLSVLAVPKEMIVSYVAFAAALDLEIYALDYIGNSIAQGMLRFIKEPVKVAIKVDEDTSMLTIIQGEKVELQRNISYGISEAVEAVMESEVYGGSETFGDALEILRRQTCMNPRLDWKDAGRAEFREQFGRDETEGSEEGQSGELRERQRLREEVTEGLRALVGNISRILDYYMSRNQEVAIEKIWLIGLGAECKGFDELLAHELGTSVEGLTELPELGLSREIPGEGFELAEYITPIAGTLAPLHFVLEEQKKDKKRLSDHEMLVPEAVCLVCLVTAAVLAAVTLIPSAVLRARNHKLTEQVESLQEAAEVYDTYTATKAEFADLETLYQMTETPDDALLSFLEEMEEKMPSDVVVVTMTAGVDGIHMNMTASSKDSVAMALMQLRSFETVSGVSTQELTEETSEEGKTVVSFSVNCSFVEEGTGEP